MPVADVERLAELAVTPPSLATDPTFEPATVPIERPAWG